MDEGQGNGEATTPRGVAAGIAALLLPCAALAREPIQVWFDQAVDTDASDTTTLRAGQSIRYSCDAHDLCNYFLEAGGGWRPLPWLSLGLAYRQQYERRERAWWSENRPYADVTVRWETPLATLTDRSRFEYRDREGQDDLGRLRNKLALQWNQWQQTTGWSPYVAAEVFMDEPDWLQERNRTRLTVGMKADAEWLLPAAVRIGEGSSAALDAYLTQQETKKDDSWQDDYILGLQLGIHF